MPVYNAESYLKDSIASILSQSLQNFELLIIDNDSTDNSMSIIKLFKKDARVKVLRYSSSHNIADVLNFGIKHSSAEIIARMDADDVSYKERLEKQYRLISQSEKIAVVGANIGIIDKQGVKISERTYPSSSVELKRCLFRYSPFAHPVVMFRKKAVDFVGGYNPKYSPTEDLDLWFRLGRYFEFCSVPEVLLDYRVYQHSSSHKILRDLEKLVFEIRMAGLLKYGYKPSFYDVVYNFLQFFTLWFMPPVLRIALYNFLRNKNLI